MGDGTLQPPKEGKTVTVTKLVVLLTNDFETSYLKCKM